MVAASQLLPWKANATYYFIFPDVFLRATCYLYDYVARQILRVRTDLLRGESIGMFKFFILAAAFLVVSCGPLPRPFIDPEPQNNSLLHLTDTRPLTISPPIIDLGVNQDQLPELVSWSQESLSQFMRDENLPAASYTFDSDSLYVQSTFAVTPLDGDSSILSLSLEVSENQSPADQIIYFTEKTTVPSRSIQANPKPLLKELMVRAARSLDKNLTSLSKGDLDTLVVKNKVRIHLSPLPLKLDKLTKQTLRDELRASFQLRNLTLSINKLTPQEGSEENLYILKLGIQQSKEDNSNLLTLSWRLLDYLTGEDVGEVTQTNAVPNITLSRIIRPASEAIAEGTALGIVDLLQQKSLQNQTVLK